MTTATFGSWLNESNKLLIKTIQVEITVEDLKSKLEGGETIHIIDVREQYEHDEFNIGGQLIPIGRFMQEVDSLSIPRNETVVVYCRSGNRSKMGQEILRMNGFEQVFNLTGGMLAWVEKFGE